MDLFRNNRISPDCLPHCCTIKACGQERPLCGVPISAEPMSFPGPAWALGEWDSEPQTLSQAGEYLCKAVWHEGIVLIEIPGLCHLCAPVHAMSPFWASVAASVKWILASKLISSVPLGLSFPICEVGHYVPLQGGLGRILQSARHSAWQRFLWLAGILLILNILSTWSYQVLKCSGQSNWLASNLHTKNKSPVPLIFMVQGPWYWTTNSRSPQKLLPSPSLSLLLFHLYFPHSKCKHFPLQHTWMETLPKGAWEELSV